MHYLIFTMHKIVMQCIFQKSVFSPLLEVQKPFILTDRQLNLEKERYPSNAN